jgi:hypothetical protein
MNRGTLNAGYCLPGLDAILDELVRISAWVLESLDGGSLSVDPRLMPRDFPVPRPPSPV